MIEGELADCGNYMSFGDILVPPNFHSLNRKTRTPYISLLFFHVLTNSVGLSHKCA